MSVARIVYSAFVYGMLPRALAHLAWRSRGDRGYREHLGERFGHYPGARPAKPVIWIHAVSVGETRAAEPLVEALTALNPDHRILLTHMTPTGRRTGETLFADRVLRAYLPYDTPRAAARFLEHFRPRLGVLMETEVWPNLIQACSARRIPLYLVNARLSEKSFRRYSRFAALARETFASLTRVAAQTREDAQRLAALGAADVAVTGNLKFDVTPSGAHLELGRGWKKNYGARPVLLAASTRDGEEALLLDALAALTVPGVLLVIVPRHPQRFDEVAALLERRGIRYQRRSAGGPVSPDTAVLLGDSMGEMAAYYAASDVAFIGGSLLPFGGQNLIEACAVGKPALLGPHTYNFAEAAERAIAAGAALRIADEKELAHAASELLRDETERARMGAAGLAFSQAHQGATQRVMQIITLGDGVNVTSDE